MLHLTITESHTEFRHGDALAGRYHHRDGFKPFFHPLNSPAGHCVTVASPHDHVHHKGLMFALRTRETNFWEELHIDQGESAGRQVHQSFDQVVASGQTVGFLEHLRWIDADSEATIFIEQRDIRLTLKDGGYHWNWRTTLTPQRDVTLVKSKWSYKTDDGRFVNYHGLGIRFRREFGGQTGNNRFVADDKAQDAGDFAAFMGQTPRSAAYTGSIDGTWPVEKATLTMTQSPEQSHGLFVMNQGFAFMALGPSNLDELPLRADRPLTCEYAVTVRDGASS